MNRPSLQALLEKLFPGQTEFNIEVCQPYPGPPLRSEDRLADGVVIVADR